MCGTTNKPQLKNNIMKLIISVLVVIYWFIIAMLNTNNLLFTDGRPSVLFIISGTVTAVCLSYVLPTNNKKN